MRCCLLSVLRIPTIFLAHNGLIWLPVMGLLQIPPLGSSGKLYSGCHDIEKEDKNLLVEQILINVFLIRSLVNSFVKKPP
jgi:hypothetical protein